MAPGRTTRPFERPPSPDPELEEQLLRYEDDDEEVGVDPEPPRKRRHVEVRGAAPTITLEALTSAMRTAVEDAVQAKERASYKHGKTRVVQELQNTVERALKAPDYGECASSRVGWGGTHQNSGRAQGK